MRCPDEMTKRIRTNKSRAKTKGVRRNDLALRVIRLERLTASLTARLEDMEMIVGESPGDVEDMDEWHDISDLE